MVTRYFPSSGEPWQGRSAYQSLRALASQAEIHVFYPNAAYPSLLSPRSRLYQSLDRGFAPAGVDVTYHDYPALPLLSRPFNGSMSARSLLPHVRAFRPDVLFGIFLYPEGYAALRLAQQLSIPTVAMGIGSDIHSIADRLSERRTREVLQSSDFLITVSEDLRRKAIALGASPERSRTVLNGCDLSVFYVGDRDEARRRLHLEANADTVVYIGRMDHRKGLRELIEAALLLRPRRPTLQVYMVGEGPDRALLEARIQETGAADFLHLLPPCAPDEVAVWMTAADLVTLPSYMEGCPNVILEALACGRPVVATRVGGIPEILNEDSGALIPPRDPQALLEALHAVLATQWEPAAISARGSRGWNAVAADLLRIFRSVVSPAHEVR